MLLTLRSLAQSTAKKLAGNYHNNSRILNGLFDYRHLCYTPVMDTKANPTLKSHQEPSHVYVQHSQEKRTMVICFEVHYAGKSKQMNMLRKLDEPLSQSLERIKFNMLKMRKKLKLKDSGEVDIIMSKDGIQLDPPNVSNSDAWKDGSILNLDGKIYEVRSDYPQVESLVIPSFIMEKFTVMPTVSLKNCDMFDCKFTWYRQINATERTELLNLGVPEEDIILDGSYWHKVSDCISFEPTNDDVGRLLMVSCQPSDGKRVGPMIHRTSSSGVEMSPPYFPFEDRHEHTKEFLKNPGEFRLVSYNVLADLYVDSDYSHDVLFKHCPAHALALEYRRQLWLKEISGYNADVICLQELDKKEVVRTFAPYFKLISNHSIVYNSKGPTVGEGVATLYRDDKFSLVESHATPLADLIEPSHSEPYEFISAHPILSKIESPEAKNLLSKFDLIREAIFRNPNTKKRYLDRHTVLQTTLLKSNEIPGSYLLVANTHLYFSPDADHIRLLQGSVCITYLEYIRNYYENKVSGLGDESRRISIVFCGDMNSSPDCGLYKLATTGKVEDDLVDWSSNESEAVKGLSVHTNLRFKSAYDGVPYTNFTPLFNGCLDYIYYNPDQLTCLSIVPMPDHDDVIANGGIPSDVFPSDHLALVADLKFDSPGLPNARNHHLPLMK